jgi:hypothetical protein
MPLCLIKISRIFVDTLQNLKPPYHKDFKKQTSAELPPFVKIRRIGTEIAYTLSERFNTKIEKMN